MTEIRASEAARDYRAMHRLLGTVRDEAVALHAYAMSREPSEEGAKLCAFLVAVRERMEALALDALAGAEGLRIVGHGLDGLRVRPVAGHENWRERPSESVRTVERAAPIREARGPQSAGESGIHPVNDVSNPLHGLPPAA